MKLRMRRTVRLTILIGAAATGATISAFHLSQEQGPAPRPFSIAAKRYRFEPAHIEVTEGDLVRIELRTEDIAHSWTIDEYRIAKRVSPGHSVTFEFRADKNGTFPIYCNLQTEDGCRQMRGELVVARRR